MWQTVAAAQRRLEATVLAGSVLAITALTVGNVGCRWLLGFSLAWTEEVSQFLIVAVTFVGLSYVAGQGRHIRMSALADALPVSGRRRLRAFVAGSTAVLLGGLALVAVDYVHTLHSLGTVSPVLRVPLWVITAVAPVGLLLGAVQYAATAVRNLTSNEVWLSASVRDSTVSNP